MFKKHQTGTFTYIDQPLASCRSKWIPRGLAGLVPDPNFDDATRGWDTPSSPASSQGSSDLWDRWLETRRRINTHRIRMYAIYGNIDHEYTPNVSIYTIHGSYGIWSNMNKIKTRCSFLTSQVSVTIRDKIGVSSPMIWRIWGNLGRKLRHIQGVVLRYVF